MSILENNLKYISKYNNDLALKILNHSNFSSEFVLEEAMSGDYVLKRNGIHLNSSIDPEQEAIDLLKNISNTHSNSFHFIYGLGLGYVLKRFNKTIKGYILVYESDLDVLKLVLEMVDFTEEFKNEKVFIFNDFNFLNSFYDKYFFYKYEISTSICETYKKYDLTNAQKFIKDLGYIHGFYLSNYQVYWYKMPRWINAFINNIDLLYNYPEVKILENKFKDKPALVISAGPSLNKNIDLIVKYQNNFVIFCVGTALKAVLAKGICPDFVCFIESIDVTAKMLDENLKSNIILQPITHRTVFEQKTKNKFLFYADNDAVSKFLAKKLNINTSEYINRGTVSVNALASAKIMGCNPIVLVGQDLAYTNNECYAKGSIYDTYKLDGENVISTNLEELLQKTSLDIKTVENRLKTLSSQLYKVKGQNGDELNSPGDYVSFIKYFTQIASVYEKDTKLINSTEGGAQIDGYENISLSAVIDNFANIEIDKTIPIFVQENKNKGIILNEIRIAVNLWDKVLAKNFQKGYEIANTMNIDYTNSSNHKLYQSELNKLLLLYKEFYLNNTSSFVNMLLERNILFINRYMKNINDETDKNNLINNLHILYKSDYESYILPNIKKLKSIIDKGDLN